MMFHASVKFRVEDYVALRNVQEYRRTVRLWIWPDRFCRGYVRQHCSGAAPPLLIVAQFILITTAWSLAAEFARGNCQFCQCAR